MHKKFKKLTCRFNDESLEFAADKAKLEWYLKDLEGQAQKMFDEIKLSCNSFNDFRKALKFRGYLELSFYVFFPITFILAIIGFESGYDAFGLAWFFLGFFIIYIMILVVVIYYVAVKMNEFFSNYSDNIQEIINKYNRKVFIKNNVFISFRFQVFEGLGKRSNKNPNNQSPMIKAATLSKDNDPAKNVKGIRFKLRSQFRSNFLKILRIKFWVEFLIKEQKALERNLKNELDLEVKQEKNEYYNPKDRDYEEKMVLKQQPQMEENDVEDINVEMREEKKNNEDEEEFNDFDANTFDKENNKNREEYD